MSLSELYHVAVVVPDLDAGCARFTELLGTRWGPIVERDVEVRDGDGLDRIVSQRLCYSTEAPYLELIEERLGTPWVCNEHSNIHHIGFFSDSLAADSLDLTTSGCPLLICGRAGESAPATYALHRDSLGIRIEVVDVAGRAGLEAWLRG
jgi:hypothetical protein